MTGIIPGNHSKREVAFEGLSEQHVVSSMHQRKALMAELSDGFIALPGGFGTLEEFVEVLTHGPSSACTRNHAPCSMPQAYSTACSPFSTIWSCRDL